MRFGAIRFLAALGLVMMVGTAVASSASCPSDVGRKSAVEKAALLTDLHFCTFDADMLRELRAVGFESWAEQFSCGEGIVASFRAGISATDVYLAFVRRFDGRDAHDARRIRYQRAARCAAQGIDCTPVNLSGVLDVLEEIQARICPT